MKTTIFKRSLIGLPLSILMLISCQPSVTETERKVNIIAERYVKAGLSMAAYINGYVDAYYGPEEWADSADANPMSLDDLMTEVYTLQAELTDLDLTAYELGPLRHNFLKKQLASIALASWMLKGNNFTFDQESDGLFGAIAPSLQAAHFDTLLRQLDQLLPGAGTTRDRFLNYRESITLSNELYKIALDGAIAFSRKITKEHISLPEGESYEREYVNGKTWSAYNWYQGNSQSKIQINIEARNTVDRVVELAAHEGYPGHHVYKMLLEDRLFNGRGWPEYQISLFYSPQSLISEGFADYGQWLVFGDDPSGYEKTVLYPMVGLDPEHYETNVKIRRIMDQLDHADHIAARMYKEKELTKNETHAWVMKYTFRDQVEAQRRVAFFEKNSSFVVNYTLGEDLVRNWIERKAGPNASKDDLWSTYEALLASPRIANSLDPTWTE